MIDENNEYPTEAGCDEFVSVIGDEYSQVDEFSDSEFQSWDNEFSQEVVSSEQGADGFLSGDMVVVRDEYSQESFARNKEKPQKSNKKEFDDAIRLINKRSAPKGSVTSKLRKKLVTKQPSTELNQPQNNIDINVVTHPISLIEKEESTIEKSNKLTVSEAYVSDGVVAKESPVNAQKNHDSKSGSSLSKGGGDVKRKYDKEGKKNRVETIKRCVLENFLNKEFTLSDVKEVIKEDIAKWEASGVSNIDVELSVCVKSMGVEVVGQAPRASGQRGRPSNIMRLIG